MNSLLIFFVFATISFKLMITMEALDIEITCYLVVCIKYNALVNNTKLKLTFVYCFSVFNETLIFTLK